jgi:hypothetical protein
VDASCKIQDARYWMLDGSTTFLQNKGEVVKWDDKNQE